MSLYVLDTDIFTLLLHKHPVVYQRVAACKPSDLAVTVITVEEQVLGWVGRLRRVRSAKEKARAYDDLAAAVASLGSLPILSFSEQAIAGHEALVKLKLNVGKMDLAIAAITLEHNATLVSRNLRDFQRVPGLTVEDWSV